MAGVISRLTLIESNGTTAGDGLTVLFFSWVAFSEQVSTENQNHPLTLPIRPALHEHHSLPKGRHAAAQQQCNATVLLVAPF